MTYSERLQHALELAGLGERGGRVALANAIGTSGQAISQVLGGVSKALTAENTARAARFLKVDWYWLATGEGAPHPYLDDEAQAVGRRFAQLSPAKRENFLATLKTLERTR